MANEIDKQINVVDGTMTAEQAAAPDYEPVYKVYENTRIPVSKSMGKLWSMRHKEAKQLLKNNGTKDRWDEAIRYYQNDQGGKSGKRRKLSELATGKDNQLQYGTENIVFANVSAIVPAVYAKNPDVEITHTKEESEPFAKLCENLVDTLFSRKMAPGLNLKNKMRRLVITTMLTNIGYVELSYVRKEDSTEQAVQEIERLSKELSEAKDINDIKEIEGKLQAVDEKVTMLTTSGPKLKYRAPEMVLVDPNHDEADVTGADYVMIGDYIRTGFLRATYGTRDEKGQWMSIYKPTHVLSGDSDAQGHDDEINNFTLLTDGSEHENYGYKDKQEFEHACRTLVWYVWDKTTRRVYMFNDKDWSWPIWVWDDPYHLSRFYPIFPLSFYTDPCEAFGRSEVMYYLDQQDEINMINNERARMRHWVMSKVFVNKAYVKDATTIQNFLQNDTDTLVHAIDLPENVKIGDVLGSFPAPSTQFEQLFDTRTVLESINRLSSVTPVLQNAQFKTNTTNKAIDTYESNTQTRLDEKIDAIEDVLGEIGQALLEMCIQFMDQNAVTELVGQTAVQAAGGWNNMSVEQFNEQFNFTIVGGSTLKPTAKVKKEQAMALGQILGQFASASPTIVIVMLKMLERAFSDDVVLTEQDWSMIVNGTMQQMQRGNSQPGQQGGQGGGQGQQKPAQGQQPAEPQAGDINVLMEQVAKVIDQLPPQAKQMLGAGIAKGIPLKQLVQHIAGAAQSSSQPQQ